MGQLHPIRPSNQNLLCGPSSHLVVVLTGGPPLSSRSHARLNRNLVSLSCGPVHDSRSSPLPHDSVADPRAPLISSFFSHLSAGFGRGATDAELTPGSHDIWAASHLLGPATFCPHSAARLLASTGGSQCPVTALIRVWLYVSLHVGPTCNARLLRRREPG